MTMFQLFLAAVCGIVIGAVLTYKIMRAEIDEAWGVAGRIGQEKEHYRLKYEQEKRRNRCQ